MQYQFDFSGLKVRDVKSVSKPDATMADFIEWLDKVTVGGVDDVPFDEIQAIGEQAAAAWMKYTEEIRSGKTALLSELLKDIDVDARRTHTVDRRGAKPL